MAARKTKAKPRKVKETPRKESWWRQYSYTPYEWVVKLILFVLLSYLALEYRGLVVAASVNGTPISRLSVVQEAEAQLGQQTLENLVNQELIRQKAESSHTTVSQEEIDARITEIEESVTASGQTLDSLLSLQGMTREMLSDQIKTQLTVEKLLAGDVTVTDEEVNTYLEENKEFLPEGQSEEENKNQAKEQLRQQKLSERFSTWISELKNEAKINYYVNY